MSLRRFRCLLALLAGFPASGAIAAEPVDFLDLDELTYAIQVAIRDTVRDQDREPYFLITGITLNLKGIETSGANGGFKLPIFEASVSTDAMIEYTATHALSIDLSPDDPIATRPVPDIQLSAIVGSVKDSFQGPPTVEGAPPADEDQVDRTGAPETARDWAGLPILVAQKFTYVYKGALRQKAGGGLDLVFFKIDVSVEQTSLQTITFNLCRTLNQHTCVDG